MPLQRDTPGARTGILYAKLCHRNDHHTEGGSTVILVRRGIGHYAVPVSNIQQLDATGKHWWATCLLPPQCLFDANLSGRAKPVFLAGDLNAENRDGNSRVNSPEGILLRECASANSCIVHGPTTVTSCPITHLAFLVQWLPRISSYQ